MDTPKENSKKGRMSEFNPICLNTKKKKPIGLTSLNFRCWNILKHYGIWNMDKVAFVIKM